MHFYVNVVLVLGGIQGLRQKGLVIKRKENCRLFLVNAKDNLVLKI